MLSIKADRPIAPLTIAVMREVDTLAKELKLTYFICGAMARDMLLQHVHGVETGTATVDVDFGVAVENWEQFRNIKARLTETGRFEPAKKMAQRLYYKLDPNSAGYPVDIIPFGGVESPPNSIAWPPDRDEVMNVIGYEEALANTVAIRIENEFIVPVISLPGLALLKLFAWTERGNKDPKDALDLVTLLRTYHEAGNQDRLYGEELKIFEAAGFDPASASPRLLGKDVRSIAKPETLAQALAILNDAKQVDRLVTHMAPRLRHADDPVAEAEHLLENFKAGLNGK
jgi:predicted nucleotidyltransferase